MLTGRDGIDDRVAGLDAGADDYLTKPFPFDELVARVRALLRRRPLLQQRILEVADLQIDTVTRRTTRAGRTIELTAKEYALLEYLASRRGELVSRAEIGAIGSQSKAEFVEGPGLVRFRFDPATRRIDRVESVSGLRRRLLSLLPSVPRAAGQREDGFNIEGLAWDHASKRLLLGLRSPVIDGHAIVLRLAVGEPQERLAPLDRLGASEADILRLPLDNSGIRSMEYDARTGGFLVVAASSGSAPFRVWNWTGGSGASARLEVQASFAARLKPEGIASVSGHRAFTLIVFDTSRYLALP